MIDKLWSRAYSHEMTGARLVSAVLLANALRARLAR